MSTDPINDFIDREYHKEQEGLYNILVELAEGVEEVVNFGSRILKWCVEPIKGNNDVNLPAILMYRHALELCDAISILLKESSVDPCKTHLRALLEVQLLFMYLTKKDYEKRSYSFLVCRIHENLKFIKYFDPKSDLGKQWKGKMKGTQLEGIQLPKEIDIQKFKVAQKQLLKKNGYKEAHQEFLRFKKERKKTPDWYQLYDGPGSLEQIAIKLGKVAEYETFYRSFSKYVHSSDLLSTNINSIDGKASIASIRKPFDAQFTVSSTLMFILEIHRKMISNFTPARKMDYDIWYKEHMQQFYKRVTKREPIIKMKKNE